MMKLKRIYVFLNIVGLVVLAWALMIPETLAASDPFPVYSCIQPNVSFWKQIYSEYTSNQGIIHDKRRLEIVYGVIDLVNADQRGGRKINRNRIKKAKRHYKAILAKLARGDAPSNTEEQQVADLFGPNAGRADFTAAMRNLRCQVGQKDRFRAGLIRSGAYIDEIKQIFRQHGLPEDLAYLPHVESSFNPKAYSKFGAAGIWQFTRSTGRRYMKVGYAIDERCDPILSSHAAAELLKDNYQRLQEWPLAITAYNHGTTGMLRAKRKKGSYERIFKEYRSRIFRFASRNFYSEFLAARDVASNYRQYFGDLQLDQPEAQREVVMDGYALIQDVARHLDVELADLRRLNPALRGPVFQGQKYVPKGFRLRLPVRPDQDWETLIAELSPEIYKQHQKRSSFYKVRRGDTASKIARMHGVRLRDLIAANNLDARATIYVNQSLRIPLPEEKPVQLARSKVQKQDRREMSADYKTPAANKPPPSTPTVDFLIARHTANAAVQMPDKEVMESVMIPMEAEMSEKKSAAVLSDSEDRDRDEKEQTDASQARKEKIEENKEIDSTPMIASVEFLEVLEKKTPTAQRPQVMRAELEPQTPQIMDVGPKKQILSVPHIDPQLVQGHFDVKRVWLEQGKPVGVIRVEVEETLGHYAEWLMVSVHEIRRMNGLRSGGELRFNQKVKIPLRHVSKEEFEEQRFEYQKKLSEDFFASYRIEKVFVYYIKRGDNIWTLSREAFDVPLWLLKRYNSKVDFNALIPSQKLLIPIVEKSV